MIYVVLPAYNEADCIVGLIRDIAGSLSAPDRDYRIVVVNDGSTDDTKMLVAELDPVYPLVLVDHQANMGLGATLRDGLEKAAGLAAPRDVIVTMDADATHEPKYIESLLEKLDEGFDVVIASRFVAGASEKGLSAWRAVLSRGAGLLLRLLFPIPGVRDYTCGFRAYKASVIKNAFERLGTEFAAEEGFSVSPEILITLHKLGAKVAEVPFVLRYDMKAGPSKMRVYRTVIAYLRMMRRLRRRLVLGR